MLSDRSLFNQVLDHEYDGIREYDNPTPAWWKWVFAATVMFSAVYWAVYHFGLVSRTIEQEWEIRQVAEFERIFSKVGTLNPDEATIARMAGDQQMLAVAHSIFQTNCTACHGRDGGGITGPNLTDDVYKNVRSLNDFYAVISKGAGNGAMPSWENRLSANERVILAAYAASLRGTTPAAPRAAEGTSFPPPWPIKSTAGSSSSNGSS